MSGHAALFAPCPDYLPIVPESTHDCADCMRQYGERAYPDFQERFLAMLCRGLELEAHQMRFLQRVRLKAN